MKNLSVLAIMQQLFQQRFTVPNSNVPYKLPMTLLSLCSCPIKSLFFIKQSLHHHGHHHKNCVPIHRNSRSVNVENGSTKKLFKKSSNQRGTMS